VLILRWDSPDNPALGPVARVRVSRQAPHTDDDVWVPLTEDAPWGCFIDREIDDPSTRYQVEFISPEDHVVATWAGDQIVRFKTDPQIALLSLSRRTVVGGPRSHFGVSVRDPKSTTVTTYNFVASAGGEITIPLQVGKRVIIHVDTDPDALDTVVPVGELSWLDLVRKGTWVPEDMRGTF
jgi:hypothetical protein